jgi:hypothetical protein
MANLAGKVNKNINALTFAAQLAKNFNDVNAGTIADNKVTIEGDDYLSAIISAGAALDDGNESQGIDSYPDDQRAVFLRSSAKASLLKKGQVIVGGSDKAQEILRRGGFDSDTDPSVATTGYLGEIDGMPCYVASKPVWALAEKYMGLSAGALDKVEMLVVSGVSTGRALAFADNVKIIDAPGGNGRRLQPCFRFGCDCWDSLSVVPVVASGFTAPEGVITVKAPGSRA